jgi:hypothetical protein
MARARVTGARANAADAGIAARPATHFPYPPNRRPLVAFTENKAASANALTGSILFT